MSTTPAFRRALLCGAAIMAGAAAAQGQITITSADMFTQPGLYYMTYANSTNTGSVDVSAWVTPAGSVAQAWDFRTGPQDVTNRYDYLAATNTPHGADFVAVGAKMAYQLTAEGTTNALQWYYFTEDPQKGDLEYGFYSPLIQDQPESVYTNALEGFPASMHLGDNWTGSSVFYTSYQGTPIQITLSSTDTVDAFGYVTLPIIGALACLRVHEVQALDEAADLGDGYTDVGTEYFLNYYWFAPGHGMVVQINSQPYGGTPPDDMGGQALTLERMFATNHPAPGTNPPPTISGFNLMFVNSVAILQWSPLTGASSYTVEYTTNLAGTITWQSLGSTTPPGNVMADPAAATPGAPARFYRVVGIVGSK